MILSASYTRWLRACRIKDGLAIRSCHLNLRWFFFSHGRCIPLQGDVVVHLSDGISTVECIGLPLEQRDLYHV
jgi:hypothetical protein